MKLFVNIVFKKIVFQSILMVCVLSVSYYAYGYNSCVKVNSSKKISNCSCYKISRQNKRQVFDVFKLIERASLQNFVNIAGLKSIGGGVKVYVFENNFPNKIEQNKTLYYFDSKMRIVFDYLDSKFSSNFIVHMKDWQYVDWGVDRDDAHSKAVYGAIGDLNVSGVTESGKSVVDIIYLPMASDNYMDNLVFNVIFAVEVYGSSGKLSADDLNEKVRLGVLDVRRNDQNVSCGALNLLWLSVLMKYVGIVAEMESSYYVASLSFTVKKGCIDPPGKKGRGIFVSAAGNDNYKVDGGDLVAYPAYYSCSNELTVAVTNVNYSTNGIQCDGNCVDSYSLERCMLVGMDGSVGASCATSFAAPRVAWFVALGEALGMDINSTPKDLSSVFNERFCKYIKDSCGFGGIPCFDPFIYLQTVTRGGSK
ncbi:MAG: hypothetical protein FD177_2568 [Desulfovibrionaceae bacterium]|nr:MAG: hypothetical protein FD177_2568 [Desulfovibrionaceae bacterium]